MQALGRLAWVALALIGAVALAACAEPDGTVNRLEIPLTRTIIDDTPPFAGLTNLFFNTPDSGIAVQAPDEARGDTVELALLYGGGDDTPAIRVARYRGPSGELAYRVDTDADLDFEDEIPLDFEREGDFLIASVSIPWTVLAPATPGFEGGADSVRYQVLRTADGRWIYGRIAEERTGTIAFPTGRRMGVVLRPRSRDHPFYSADDSRLYLDKDGDGKIATEPSVTRDGRPAAAEEVDMREPFLAEGRAWRVDQIAPAGNHLVVNATNVEVATAEGFQAPSLEVTALDGSVLSLDSLRGGPVLIDFWSTECTYSEAVRPELNALVDRFAGDGFERISIAREESVSEVEAFLENHPRNGQVVAGAADVWERYNPDVVTPMLVLIDGDGIIQFRGRGASAATGLEAAAARMLDRGVR